MPPRVRVNVCLQLDEHHSFLQTVLSHINLSAKETLLDPLLLMQLLAPLSQ